MNNKLKEFLNPMELKTMLLFAFDKFVIVELVVRNETVFDTLSDVVQDQTFLKVFSSQNKTSIYLELPITYVLNAKYLDGLSTNVSLHFKGWNNNYSNEAFD